MILINPKLFATRWSLKLVLIGFSSVNAHCFKDWSPTINSFFTFLKIPVASKSSTWKKVSMSNKWNNSFWTFYSILLWVEIWRLLRFMVVEPKCSFKQRFLHKVYLEIILVISTWDEGSIYCRFRRRLNFN